MVMEDVGLRGPTCNKHLHNIRRVFELLRSKNQHLPALEIGKLLTPEDKLARESREQMSSEIARDIFKLPPWTGCHGPNKRLTKGAVILHDALFYVLILVWYTGARREEICKLMLDDVITTVIPHIKIRETETGRVKNANAVRDVPLHTELLRLGFLAYVEKMRAEGEKYLFPELYPQSQTKRSLGDVFYKLWWIYIKPLVSDLERGQAFHSVRHTVSDTFKQAGYSEEHRNDFLGHSQKDRGEGPDRYSNPLNLKAKQKMLKALIVVTNHLPDVTEITLLPTEMRQGRPSRQG
jgi:integrase